MPNPIFDNARNDPPNQGLFGLISQLRNGGADALFNQMYKSNPQFRDFANSMRGKDPRDAFKERGLDYDKVRDMMR